VSTIVFDPRDVHCADKEHCKSLCPDYCQRCERNSNRDNKKWYPDDPYAPGGTPVRFGDHFQYGADNFMSEHPERYL